MEISIYEIHNVLAKYRFLQRYVFFVSDCLVFLCSFLCCQCFQYLNQEMETMSDDFIAKRPKVITVIRETEVIANPLKTEQVVIDIQGTALPKFTPVQDSTELKTLVEGPDKIVTPAEKDVETMLTKLTESSMLTEKSTANKKMEDFPTVHSYEGTRVKDLQRIC